MTTQKPSRRDFIKTTATSVGTVAAIAPTTANAAESSSANSKLRIGFIGPGGRGFGAHVKRLAKLQVEGQPIELVAVCDVYNKAIEPQHTSRRKPGRRPTSTKTTCEMYRQGEPGRGLHRHARSLARQTDDRLPERGTTRLLRKADDQDGRRSDRGDADLGKVRQGDAGRRAVDQPARLEPGQRDCCPRESSAKC